MTNGKKISLSLIIFIISGISLAAFSIYPLFKEIEKNSSQILSQKQDLALLELKIENLKKFRKENTEIRLNLAKVEGFFVSAELPVDFIRFLEKTSRDANVSIKISPAVIIPAGDNSPWPVSNFSLSLTGSFSHLSQFLDKLLSSQYLVEIQNLNAFQAENGEIKSGLSIKVYSK